jgi:hypothetical protein
MVIRVLLINFQSNRKPIYGAGLYGVCWAIFFYGDLPDIGRLCRCGDVVYDVVRGFFGKYRA